MSKEKNSDTVVRFSFPSRMGHGVQAISFIILLLTGSALVFRGFGALIGPGGLRSFSNIHHLFGLIFTFVPVTILVFFSWKNTKRWLYDITHWNKGDVEFVKAFPKTFFGFKAETPKQGRFNGGEKINSLLQIVGCTVLIITGWILLVVDPSLAIVGWARLIHSFAALGLGSVVLAHAFLATLHPGSKESIKGMLGGRVSREWARHHHALWVEELESREADKSTSSVADRLATAKSTSDNNMLPKISS